MSDVVLMPGTVAGPCRHVDYRGGKGAASDDHEHPHGQRLAAAAKMAFVGVRANQTIALVLATGAAFLAFSAAALGASYTVTGAADSTAPCAATSCPSLRAAVIAANGDPGSTITLGPLAYILGNGPGATVGTGELRISADTTIAGAGSGATTIRQSDGANRVINVMAGAVTISGLRVTGGTLVGAAGTPGSGTPGGPGAAVSGAGIQNAGSLTLRDVVVSGNAATGGPGGAAPNAAAGNGGNALGAGMTTSGPLTMVSSAVSGNAADGGAGGGAGQHNGGVGGNAFGGIYIEPSSTGAVTLQRSAVSNNTAMGGAGGSSAGSGGQPGPGGDATGGISQWSQNLTLVDSTVAGNTATGGVGGEAFTGPNGRQGGGADAAGIVLVGGALRLERVTISGNRAIGGAGGRADGTTSGGGGTALGGGLLTFGDATLVDVTITGNSAAAGAPGAPYAGGTVGPAGGAFGGGIEDADGAANSVTLANVTLASNAATSGANLSSGASTVKIEDTIISSSAGTNCVLGAAIADLGHNLESTTPSQCGFSTAAHDLVGSDPLLQAPAVNDGTTLTMALAPASPARAAGGQCVDPTNGGQPLAVDQRGQPRPNPCDIGAFQTESPANTVTPQVSGTPLVGRSIACSQGTWTGDSPLSYSVQWLRGGVLLAPATGFSYVTTASDVGKALSCRVSATNAYGQASATSNAVTIGIGNGPPPGFDGATLVSSHLTIDRRGNVTLTVRCPTGVIGGRCVSALGLYATSGTLPARISVARKRPRGAILLGQTHASLRAGTTSTVRIHLNRSGRSLAARRARFRARLILTSHDGQRREQTHRYTTTIAPAPKRHGKTHSARADAAAGAAFTDGFGIHVRSAHRLDPRLLELSVQSAAIAGPANVRILLPSGYAAHPNRRYGVLYLFYGTSGAAADWTTRGDAERTTAGRPVIVVMPDIGLNGDGGGWCTDWVRGAHRRWETFHIAQLVPWVDANLRTSATRGARAIAGLSQGGFCSMSYAARHPDLFGIALSYSGVPDIAYDTAARVGFSGVLNGIEAGLDHVAPNSIFGPVATDEINWAAHDPTTLAGNLSNTKMFIFTGNGTPGPLDPRPYNGTDPTETGVHALNQFFHNRLRALGIASVYDDYGSGTHSWPYWARDLRESMAPLTRAFAQPGAAIPARFSYTSADPRYSVFGWTVTMHRRVRELSTLGGAGASGFSVSGSGRASVRTAALYTPGAVYVVRSRVRRMLLRASARGRLTIPVALGPSNTVQEYPHGGPPVGTKVYMTRVSIGALRR